MKLRVLVGGTDRERARSCYQEIISALDGASRQPLYLITASHLVGRAEREILAQCAGFDRLRIVTLPQLALEILRQQGHCVQVASGLESRLLLRAAIDDVADQLFYLKEAAHRQGFANAVGETLAEIRSLGISLEEFIELVGTEGFTSGLHRDLALVAQSYQQRMQDKDDSLSLLARAGLVLNRLERDNQSEISPSWESSWRQARVWILGLSLPTPLELALLEEVALTCFETTIVLSDGETSQDPPTALKQWMGRLQEKGCSVCKVPSVKASLEPALLPAVKIRVYEGEREEIAHTAALITTLVRDQKVRWKDISVVVGDEATYSREIAETFASYGIPHSLLTYRRGGFHPLIQGALLLLEAVDSRLGQGPVLDLIKSPLWPGTFDNKSLLELYARANGISGELWISPEPWPYRQTLELEEEPWQAKNEAQLQAQVEKAREILTPLEGLYRRLAPIFTGDSSVQGLAREEILGALWAVLEELDYSQCLLADQETGDGIDRGAINHLLSESVFTALWTQLVEAFDLVRQLLPETVKDWRQVSTLLRGAIDEIQIPTPQAMVDEVQILSPAQTLEVSHPFSFVLGCIEGGIDPLPEARGLLPGSDLIRLRQRAGVSYPARIEQWRQTRDLYRHHVITSATEKLWISYPKQRGDTDCYPHALVTMVDQSCFDCQWEFVQGPIPVEQLTNFEAAAHSIEVALEASDPETLAPRLDLYRWMLEDERGRRALTRQIIPLADPGKYRFDATLARQLYRYPLVTSISQLEQHSRCPLAHWLRYGLRVQKPTQYQLEMMDFGTIIHHGLKEVLLEIEQRGDSVGGEEVRQIVDRVLERILTNIKGGILHSDGRHRQLQSRLRTRLIDAVDILLTEMRRSQFKPLALELEFGFHRSIPALQLDLGAGECAYLRGKIDRVDVAEIPGIDAKVVRVWDYKLGSRRLDLMDIADGLALQLLGYLLLLVEHGLDGKPLLPGAVQYFRVADGFLPSDSGPVSEDKRAKEWEKQYQLSGLFAADTRVLMALDSQLTEGGLYPLRLKKDGQVYSQDETKVVDLSQWPLLLGQIRGHMVNLVRDILAGNACPQPYRRGSHTACDWCDYRWVCPFDPNIIGYEYREGRVLTGRAAKEYLFMEANHRGGESHGRP